MGWGWTETFYPSKAHPEVLTNELSKLQRPLIGPRKSATRKDDDADGHDDDDYHRHDNHDDGGHDHYEEEEEEAEKAEEKHADRQEHSPTRKNYACLTCSCVMLEHAQEA